MSARPPDARGGLASGWLRTGGDDADKLCCGDAYRVMSAVELHGAERATVDHPVNGREVDAEVGRDLFRGQEHQERLLMRSHLWH
jgi:hypothetical protein